MNSLATGTGEVALTPVGQQSRIPPTFSTSRDSMNTRAPYIQPPPHYSRPVRVSDVNQNTRTENVPVKQPARNPLIKDVFLVVSGMLLCGIPLAVISTVYAQEKTSCSTTSASNATTASTSVAIVVLPNQCTSYWTNNDSTRNIAYGPGAACDNGLTIGWYRFMGGAGSYLATSYVSRDTCGTYYGGSYSGSLPLTAGATTYGSLCLNNNGYLCYSAWSGSLIGITNCNGYYVYYLSAITNCNSRYCTTN